MPRAPGGSEHAEPVRGLRGTGRCHGFTLRQPSPLRPARQRVRAQVLPAGAMQARAQLSRPLRLGLRPGGLLGCVPCARGAAPLQLHARDQVRGASVVAAAAGATATWPGCRCGASPGCTSVAACGGDGPGKVGSRKLQPACCVGRDENPGHGAAGPAGPARAARVLRQQRARPTPVPHVWTRITGAQSRFPRCGGLLLQT
mmetsp:Transcript_30150/g.87817  ORF Transcript_30150/g.87817 Transcript_30150/m.87817 type:complete len:201 (+) Transcript_30150:129-731(+)